MDPTQTPELYDSDKRKALSIVSHGAIFFSSLFLSVGLPIAILLISNDPIVKDNARESINFHFNVWLYAIIFGILTIVLIGYPLLAILFVIHWVMPIIGILKILKDSDHSYRYPFIFRLLG
ncbi:MAG: DUF4870 domain-containing protein [Leptolyngbya sp. DLM2.Bin15]|nr:MAG: DUF4870 domain-containing protein [Leptolyngbya sp. DLM2.Bin15]